MLKTIRHNRGLTQKLLAERCGIPIRRLAKYERRPENIPAVELKKFSGILDTSFDLLRMGISGSRQSKQVLLLAGRFDSGKSSFANFLLGRPLLPCGHGPLTKLITIVMHVRHRPKSHKATYHICSDEFDPKAMLDAENLARSRLFARMRRIGHRYTHKDVVSDQCKYLIVYSNSPILRYCSIIDLPGLDHTEKDDQVYRVVIDHADHLVYLSTIIGFMGSTDIENLTRLAKSMYKNRKASALPSIHVGMTHVYPERVSDGEIKSILHSAGRRLKGLRIFRSLASNPGIQIYPFLRESRERNKYLERAVLVSLAELD